MVAAQEAQAQAILQQARVNKAGGAWRANEDFRRDWKGRLE